MCYKAKVRDDYSSGDKVMWRYDYRDQPQDSPLKSQPVETGKGLIGCEMHEVFGWGDTRAHQPEPLRGFWLLLATCFGIRDSSKRKTSIDRRKLT